MNCEVCGKVIVPPTGLLRSPLLLVGEFPGYHEIMRGHAWAGPAGKVLESELKKVGIQIWDARSTNLWLHEPDTEHCDIAWHKGKLMLEIPGRKAILLMGSDVSRELFGIDISKANGLLINDEMLMGIPTVLAFNPAMVLRESGVLGEFRLAVQKFAEIWRKQNV